MQRSWWAWTTLVAALLPPATATALDAGPKVAISGTPRVGAVLDAVARFDDDDATATYAWQACTGTAASSCRPIAGATASRYVPTDLDVGQRIQVRLTVREDDDDDAKVVSSALTAPVAAAPAAPGGSDPPPAPPQPGPTAPPPAASSDAAPVAGSSVPRPVRAAPRRPRQMRPAPSVRIAGFVTRTGAMITRLSVRAPRGATITVRCTGAGCPRRTLARATAVTALGEFERHLPAGVRLEIRVTRPGYVGKHTLIRIRRGTAPTRRDRCLYPDSSAPRRCAG